jgi:hypothetical protein
MLARFLASRGIEAGRSEVECLLLKAAHGGLSGEALEAVALGVPVLLYKTDSRVGFLVGEDSMILGLSAKKVITDKERLARAITRTKGKKEATDDGRLPPNIRLLAALGEESAEKMGTVKTPEALAIVAGTYVKSGLL